MEWQHWFHDTHHTLIEHPDVDDRVPHDGEDEGQAKDYDPD